MRLIALAGPKSIAWRLNLALGLVAVLVFAAAGFLLQRSLEEQLTHADREELEGKVLVVGHFVEEARTVQDLETLRVHIAGLLAGHERLQVWLVDRAGASVYGGPLPRVIAGPDGRGHLRLAAPAGMMLDAMETASPAHYPGPVARTLVAIDTQPRERLLARYRVIVAGICTMGVVLVLALGGFATWRGLRAVKRLSTEASGITPHSLGTRLSDTHDDAELTGLVQSFNGVLDRLEAAYRQMEAFSADVAHELRTPLATLINGSQVILASDRGKEELREVLASHLEELEQMKALINDMLFLARADQGNRARELQDTDLAAEVDLSIDYCEPLIGECGVTVVREGAGRALCSAALIRRALMNLLVNAIRHTAAGGRITLRIEPRERNVRLSALNPGEPIPPAVAERMFDRFFRADAAREGTGESHGLGLTIVRAIARMHGGTVFVETNADGNRIGFDIPITPASAEGPTAA